ncbi:unnamed protein product [Symbiodinium pilosum]|uniref:Cell wall protein n=1 Tax=Symbiodinium pilosum TaxID=2952 RepID=A0A812IVU1_SYMPI|nr:unnamed protein product [Symbiodinium pilosum]
MRFSCVAAAVCVAYLLQAQAKQSNYDTAAAILQNLNAKLGAAVMATVPTPAHYAQVLEAADEALSTASKMLDEAVTKLDTITVQIPSLPNLMETAHNVQDQNQAQRLQIRMGGLMGDLCEKVSDGKIGEQLATSTTMSIQHLMDSLTTSFVENNQRPESAMLAPFFVQFKAAVERGTDIAAKAKAIQPLAGVCSNPLAVPKPPAEEAPYADVLEKYSQPALPSKQTETGFHFPSALLLAGE